MKIALTDIETTGLKPLKHEIIEIGVVIFDNTTFEIYGQFNFKIKPERIEDADPKALEVNGYNKKDWEDGMTLMKTLNFYAEATEGCVFMAHNAMFDWSFLEVASEQKNVPFKFKTHHKIDTVSIAWAKVPHNKVFSWSLKTLCSYFGIPPEPSVHRAVNGALCTYQVYKKLMELK